MARSAATGRVQLLVRVLPAVPENTALKTVSAKPAANRTVTVLPARFALTEFVSLLHIAETVNAIMENIALLVRVTAGSVHQGSIAETELVITGRPALAVLRIADPARQCAEMVNVKAERAVVIVAKTADVPVTTHATAENVSRVVVRKAVRFVSGPEAISNPRQPALVQASGERVWGQHTIVLNAAEGIFGRPVVKIQAMAKR